ncbi:hypothetical protein [Sporofaciens sp. JLR.KK001]|jgi:hypothetical protein|uniref:hypothetical protein n=1 Tax=Sporofaciens sp. JLR.KK001 TaxID=3112621 RepID=UPI002FEF5549
MELEKKKLPERLLLGLLQTKAEAMRQIEDNDYISLLKQHGIQEIHSYGIACYKKTCKIMHKLNS